MHRALVLPLLLAGVLALVVGVGGLLTGALDRFEDDSIDLRYEIRGSGPVEDIAVVAIDERSFSSLRTTWPLPRTVHAAAIDRLRAAGARRIVYDVQFTEPSADPAADIALYRAVTRAGNVILATGESDGRGNTAVLGGTRRLAAAGAHVGAANFPAGLGGVIRQYPRKVGGLASIAVATAETLGVRAGPFEDGTAWIDFRGPPRTIPTYSLSDVLGGRIDRDHLRGRIVVVGASAPTLQDLHPAATTGRRLMSGPELQANAIWTALHGNRLRTAPPWLVLALVIGLALLGPLVALLFGPVRLLFAAPLIAALHAGATLAAFTAGIVVAYAAPAASLLVGSVGAVAVGIVVEARERRRVADYNCRLELEVRRATEDLRESQLEVVTRLAHAAELRDDETGAHVERMSRLCEAVGRRLGMTPAEAELLRHASALHDIGKIGIPDEILLHRGPLDAAQRELMERHAERGAELLAGSGTRLLQLAETVARTHHERWDGSGYPRGLRGEEIPLAGRIAAVCDVHDALSSERPYKRAWSDAEVRSHLRAERGRLFDPAVVDALLDVLGPPTSAAAPRESRTRAAARPSPARSSR